MTQFDLLTFSSLIFWFFLCFSFMYLFFIVGVLPRLYFILISSSQFFINLYDTVNNGEFLFLVYFTFVSFFTFLMWFCFILVIERIGEISNKKSFFWYGSLDNLGVFSSITFLDSYCINNYFN